MNTSKGGLSADALGTLEAQRVAILFIDAEVREIRRSLPDNAAIAARLGAVESVQRDLHTRFDTMQSKSFGVQISDFFAKLFGLGDNARRPWVWLTLLLVLVLAAAAWFGRGVWFDPAAREERVEAARAQYLADSLAAAREYELAKLRLERGQVQITVPDGAVLDDEAAADTATDAP